LGILGTIFFFRAMTSVRGPTKILVMHLHTT